jgi:hypothetical protein
MNLSQIAEAATGTELETDCAKCSSKDYTVPTTYILVAAQSHLQRNYA